MCACVCVCVCVCIFEWHSLKLHDWRANTSHKLNILELHWTLSRTTHYCPAEGVLWEYVYTSTEEPAPPQHIIPYTDDSLLHSSYCTYMTTWLLSSLHPPLVVNSPLCHTHCTLWDGREALSSPTSPDLSLLARHCQSLRWTRHSHCHHHVGTGRCPYTDSGGPPRYSAL